MNKKTTTFYATQILENHSLLILNVNESRRSVRDLTSETSKGSKTRLYQIVHNTDSVFLIVELAITRSKMGLETSLFFFDDQQNALNNMLCQTPFIFFRLKVPFATPRHKCVNINKIYVIECFYRPLNTSNRHITAFMNEFFSILDYVYYIVPELN